MSMYSNILTCNKTILKINVYTVQQIFVKFN